MGEELKNFIGFATAIIITFVVIGTIFSRVVQSKDSYEILRDTMQEKLTELGDYRLEYVTQDQFRMWADNTTRNDWEKLKKWVRKEYPDIMFEYENSMKTNYEKLTIYTDYQEEKSCICIWVERVTDDK